MSHHPRPVGLAVAIVFIAAACGGSTDPRFHRGRPRRRKPHRRLRHPFRWRLRPLLRSALVGEWARETRRDEIVARLTEAGLEASVLDTAAAFVPGAASGADIKNPQRRDALSRFGTPTSSPPTASSDLGTRTATRSMTAGIA